jgi:hypothetical protein
MLMEFLPFENTFGISFDTRKIALGNFFQIQEPLGMVKK